MTMCVGIGDLSDLILSWVSSLILLGSLSWGPMMSTYQASRKFHGIP